MKYLIILVLAISLISCNDDEISPTLNQEVYGTYSQDGDGSGVLIVNENYIDYREAWHTTEYDLTEDSLKFHFSMLQEGTVSDSVTWWFELRIYENKLEGNQYRTVNWDKDIIYQPGIVTFIKL